jgi:hypothetical protein
MYPSIDEVNMDEVDPRTAKKKRGSEPSSAAKRTPRAGSAQARASTVAVVVTTSESEQRDAEYAWLTILNAHNKSIDDKSKKTRKTKARTLSDEDTARYAAALAVNGISEQDAMALTDARLKKVGISKASHRAAVLDCVREMVVKEMQKKKQERIDSETVTTDVAHDDNDNNDEGDEPSLKSVWYSLLLENNFKIADAERYDEFVEWTSS